MFALANGLNQPTLLDSLKEMLMVGLVAVEWCLWFPDFLHSWMNNASGAAAPPVQTNWKLTMQTTGPQGRIQEGQMEGEGEDISYAG